MTGSTKCRVCGKDVPWLCTICTDCAFPIPDRDVSIEAYKEKAYKKAQRERELGVEVEGI